MWPRPCPQRCWWFEAVELAKKVLLTGVVIFIPLPQAQLLFAIVVAFFLVVFTLTFKPYRADSDDFLNGVFNIQVPRARGQ